MNSWIPSIQCPMEDASQSSFELESPQPLTFFTSASVMQKKSAENQMPYRYNIYIEAFVSKPEKYQMTGSEWEKQFELLIAIPEFVLMMADEFWSQAFMHALMQGSKGLLSGQQSSVHCFLQRSLLLRFGWTSAKFGLRETDTRSIIAVNTVIAFASISLLLSLFPSLQSVDLQLALTGEVRICHGIFCVLISWLQNPN